jgi:hypothetical protein
MERTMTGRSKSLCSAVVLATVAGSLAACGDGNGGGGGRPPAVIVNRILATQLVGSADDGDSETAPDRYNGAADLDATDRRTKASSVAARFDRVSGKAEAEAFDPASNTLTSDVAIATSNNKVVSSLTVNGGGPFTFHIELDVDRVVVRNGATVEIQVVAAILDSQGSTVPGGGITNTSFLFRPNGAGGTEVIIQDDGENPDATEGNGDYDRTLSGPNGGIALRPGAYRLELDLRIRAIAPIQTGPDGRRDRAAVEAASATIRLR